ncbi:MAG: hypothetical protein ACHQ53_01850 [Polyangiales bacterium]
MILASAASAAAHPAPAASPDFGQPPCVTRIDKDKQGSFSISYAVQSDITMLTQGDLPLPDANTYQFFAFDGLVVPYSTGYQLYPYGRAEAMPIDLPIWITADDVKRAAKASQTLEGVLLSQSSIPASEVLADSPDLRGSWSRVTSDDARIPITMAAAMTGATWDLTQVAPGVYTLATYIFSPPNNGWAIRPGAIKVVDATHDMPGGAITSIQEHVFSYQGRRVTACLDVPVGTRLDAYYRVDERPELGWTQWVQGRDVSSGTLDLCFHAPTPDLVGSVYIRFDLVGPDGDVTTLHSPDTLTALPGSGPCSPTTTLCCDFPGAETQAAVPDAGDGMEGATSAASDAGASLGATRAPARAPGRVATSKGGGSPGCSVGRAETASSPLAGVSLLLLAACRLRRRSRRHLTRGARATGDPAP